MKQSTGVYFRAGATVTRTPDVAPRTVRAFKV